MLAGARCEADLSRAGFDELSNDVEPNRWE